MDGKLARTETKMDAINFWGKGSNKQWAELLCHVHMNFHKHKRRITEIRREVSLVPLYLPAVFSMPPITLVQNKEYLFFCGFYLQTISILSRLELDAKLCSSPGYKALLPDSSLLYSLCT